MTEGSSFIQQRIKSYADVVTSPAVLTSVSEGYGVSVSAGQISVTAPADTVLLDITVTDTDPARAVVIANGIADKFPATSTLWKSFRSRWPRRSGSR